MNDEGASLHSLPLFHRIAEKRVVVVGTGAMADAKKRLVERAGGEICAETEAHHARLAFVALDDERKAEAAANRLRGKGLLVNVADRPDLCDFTLPSILERGDVLVAVSTGGASAGLAKHLRLRLERMLPQSLSVLASGLAAAKDRLRSRFPSAASRRAAIDSLLQEGGPLDPFDENSASRIETALAKSTIETPSQRFEFTIASEDPDDLTVRQARLLGIADTVIYDAALPQAILARARADAERFTLDAVDVPEDGITVILHRGDPAG